MEHPSRWRIRAVGRGCLVKESLNMKLLALISAGLIAGGAMPVTANAQAVHHTVVKTTTTTRTVSNNHHGRTAHWRNVCKTRWHNHHKVRRCTKVRYWS
jgi:hypothetical protein